MNKQYLIKYNINGSVKFKTAYSYKKFLIAYKSAKKIDEYAEVINGPTLVKFFY